MRSRARGGSGRARACPRARAACSVAGTRAPIGPHETHPLRSGCEATGPPQAVGRGATGPPFLWTAGRRPREPPCAHGWRRARAAAAGPGRPRPRPQPRPRRPARRRPARAPLAQKRGRRGARGPVVSALSSTALFLGTPSLAAPGGAAAAPRAGAARAETNRVDSPCGFAPLGARSCAAGGRGGITGRPPRRRGDSRDPCARARGAAGRAAAPATKARALSIQLRAGARYFVTPLLAFTPRAAPRRRAPAPQAPRPAHPITPATAAISSKPLANRSPPRARPERARARAGRRQASTALGRRSAGWSLLAPALARALSLALGARRALSLSPGLCDVLSERPHAGAPRPFPPSEPLPASDPPPAAGLGAPPGARAGPATGAGAGSRSVAGVYCKS